MYYIRIQKKKLHRTIRFFFFLPRILCGIKGWDLMRAGWKMEEKCKKATKPCHLRQFHKTVLHLFKISLVSRLFPAPCRLQPWGSCGWPGLAGAAVKPWPSSPPADVSVVGVTPVGQLCVGLAPCGNGLMKGLYCHGQGGMV